MLGVVNTGPGRAFLGHRESGAAGYECMELVRPLSQERNSILLVKFSRLSPSKPPQSYTSFGS